MGKVIENIHKLGESWHGPVGNRYELTNGFGWNMSCELYPVNSTVAAALETQAGISQAAFEARADDANTWRMFDNNDAVPAWDSIPQIVRDRAYQFYKAGY